jgi:hypothetical protein
MKSYRCVVRSAVDQAVPKTLDVTAADCRAAARVALDELLAKETDWIEVWHRDELVLRRRKSNLYPRGTQPPVAKPPAEIRR